MWIEWWVATSCLWERGVWDGNVMAIPMETDANQVFV